MFEGFQFPTLFGVDKHEQTIDTQFGYCPHCSAEKLFRRIEISAAFVFLGLPVRQYGKTYYVRCTGCNRMFKESEITEPPVDEYGELTTRIRRLIVSFFVDIANDQPQTLDNVRKTCSRMFDQDVSSETLSEDIRAISYEIKSTSHWVRDQSCEMGMATRVKIFDAVIHVLNDSGIAIAEHTERLAEFGSHLILDEETVTATIAHHVV